MGVNPTIMILSIGLSFARAEIQAASPPADPGALKQQSLEKADQKAGELAGEAAGEKAGTGDAAGQGAASQPERRLRDRLRSPSSTVRRAAQTSPNRPFNPFLIWLISMAGAYWYFVVLTRRLGENWMSIMHEDYEYKVLYDRWSFGGFGKLAKLRVALDREAEFGWELHEKLDDNRLRLRRRREPRPSDSGTMGDPYRSHAKF